MSRQYVVSGSAARHYDNTNYKSVRKYERGTPCAGAQGAIGATRHGAVSLSKFALTGRDFWLRTRDGRFELKVPQNAGNIGSRMTDQYREIETDAEIAKELKVVVRGGLGETVKTLGYKPFARIVTRRESYQKGGFHLDFDETDFGFSAFEVELMVEKPKDISDAEERIMDFARAHHFTATEGITYGKVIEYIKRHNPRHYAFLTRKGVV